MKLKSFDGKICNQFLRLPDTHLTLMWIDAGEWNHYIAILHRFFCDFLIRDSPSSHFKFSIYRKHDEGNVQASIIVTGFLDRRPLCCLEIFYECFVQVRPEVIKWLPAADFSMSMYIDCDYFFKIDHPDYLGCILNAPSILITSPLI